MKKLTLLIAALGMVLSNAFAAVNYRSLEDFEQSLALNYMNSSASATVGLVTTHFDFINEYEEKGVAFDVDFEINGAQGYECSMLVTFYFEGGQPLKDFDNNYYSGDGVVAASVTFTPPYPSTEYTDLRAFIPYDQLHLDPGTHNLEYRISIHVGNTQLVIIDPLYMTFTQN